MLKKKKKRKEEAKLLISACVDVAEENRASESNCQSAELFSTAPPTLKTPELWKPQDPLRFDKDRQVV